MASPIHWFSGMCVPLPSRAMRGGTAAAVGASSSTQKTRPHARTRAETTTYLFLGRFDSGINVRHATASSYGTQSYRMNTIKPTDTVHQQIQFLQYCTPAREDDRCLRVLGGMQQGHKQPGGPSWR